MLAIFMGTVVASNFRAAMTYELLLIVVLGGIGSISGSVIGALLFVFASEWWLRGLDSGTFLGINLPLFRNGFRLVVFSVIIMIVVLFFRKGIMGDKELPYMLNKWKGRIVAAIHRKRGTGSGSGKGSGRGTGSGSGTGSGRGVDDAVTDQTDKAGERND